MSNGHSENLRWLADDMVDTQNYYEPCSRDVKKCRAAADEIERLARERDEARAALAHLIEAADELLEDDTAAGVVAVLGTATQHARKALETNQ